MKLKLNLFLLIIAFSFLSACNDDDEFIGTWRDNFGTGSIIFKKGDKVVFNGQNGTWKSKFERRSCMVCPLGGTLSITIPGRTINYYYTFGDSKRSVSAFSRSASQGDKKILRLFDRASGDYSYYTHNDLPKSLFPSSLPAGIVSESNGLPKYSVATKVRFTDNHVFANISRRADKWEFYEQLYRKSEGKWSRVTLPGISLYPDGSARVIDSYVQGTDLIVHLNDNKLASKTKEYEGKTFFSTDEGETFQKLPSIFPNKKPNGSYIGPAEFTLVAFDGDLYVRYVYQKQLSDKKEASKITVKRMKSYKYANRGAWEIVYSEEVEGSLSSDFHSDGSRLILAHKNKVIVSSDGINWNSEASIFSGRENYYGYSAAKDGLTIKLLDKKVFSLDNTAQWNIGYALASSYDYFLSTDGNNIYLLDSDKGEAYSVFYGDPISAKKTILKMTHPGRKNIKTFAGNGRFYFATNGGLFSKSQ